MFKTPKIIFGAFMALVSALPAPAFAFGPGSMIRSLGSDARVEFISASHRVAAPFASILFCKKNPDECKVHRSRWSRLEVTLDERRLAALQDVNQKINRAIRPEHDAPGLGGVDNWVLAPKAGDCNDYAVTKRHELIARGWPSQALRLGIAYTSYGEGHMVLLVKTTGGDLVLDNRVAAIRHWNKTGLRWVMVQSAANPSKWMAI